MNLSTSIEGTKLKMKPEIPGRRQDVPGLVQGAWQLRMKETLWVRASAGC
ncbi:MAG TPA: hypothetical protein VL981_13885 [Candidatus Methylacidiphilales bacterium]|nr:hypothetical protein [Candidatus Methylacidiphilales bacterium]